MVTTSDSLEEIIDATVTIPTIPSTLQEITRIFASADASAREAGEVIDRDPAIAAKVLRLVNSSLYSLRNPVSDIQLACSILGLKVIKNVVVQATVLETFGTGSVDTGLDPSWLWDHSFKTATAARLLAIAASDTVAIDKDDAYTCGLVHDIGKMVLLESQPEKLAKAVKRSNADGMPLAQAEQAVLGFSHAEVGGLLAKRWQLADDLQTAVADHHDDDLAERGGLGFLVACANSIAHTAAKTTGGYVGDVLDDELVARLGLEQAEIEDVRVQTASASLKT